MIEQYYYWLSTLARVFTQPISALADQINIPLVSALLFGLIGATAPCPNHHPRLGRGGKRANSRKSRNPH